MSPSSSWTQKILLGITALAAVGLLALPDDPPYQGAGAGEDRGQEPAPPIAADELVPVDPTYFEVAAATGGDFYFWEPGEFGRATELAVPVPAETVLVAHGTLAGRRTFRFPVDAVTRRIQLVCGAQGLADVLLRTPSGVLVDAGPSARVQVYRRMRLFSIEDPPAGEWTVELAGEGLYSLSVRASWDRDEAIDLEPIELIGASFVELRGRPGHEGWFPVPEVPAIGVTAVLELHVSGAHASFEPVFFGKDGTAIDAQWSPGPDEEAEGFEGDERLFRVIVPPAAFRIAVRGVDRFGNPYQRVDPRLWVRQ